MPLLVKHIAVGVAGVVFTLGLVHIFLLPTIRHEWRAILMRVEAVLAMESAVAIGCYIFWKTLKPLPCILSSNAVSASVNSAEVEGTRPRSLSLSGNSVCNEKTLKISPTSRSKQSLLWKAFLVFFIFMCHFSYLTNVFLSGGSDPDWFSFSTYLCLGILIQFNTGLLIIKCVSFILKHVRMHISGKITESQPRGLSQKTTTSFALVYMLFVSSLGIYTVSQLPPVKRVNIQLHNLSPNLQGFRIVQLTDIHLGPTVGKTRLQKIVDIVNTQNADVVVITGDLVDGSAKQLKEFARPLSSIRSKYGAMFSSGNHEYYTGDVDNWFRLLQQYDVKVLHNSNVKFPPGAENQICFAGSDDLQADRIGYGEHHFSAADAVRGCDGNQPTILLAHQPRAARRGIDEDVGIDLVLSGHTHGGQMFPINIFVYLLEPYYLGLYQYKGSQIYVSTGTQYWGIPMRIGTDMEITAITLTSSMTS